MAWTFYNASGEALVQHAESEATQAELEAETAIAHFVPPDLVKNSPGVAKGWCRITAAGAIESPDYNVDSVTDTGTGNRTIVWDTDFSTNVYVVLTTSAAASNIGDVRTSAHAVGSVVVEVLNSGFTGLQDTNHSNAAFGDQ